MEIKLIRRTTEEAVVTVDVADGNADQVIREAMRQAQFFVVDDKTEVVI